MHTFLFVLKCWQLPLGVIPTETLTRLVQSLNSLLALGPVESCKSRDLPHKIKSDESTIEFDDSMALLSPSVEDENPSNPGKFAPEKLTQK